MPEILTYNTPPKAEDKRVKQGSSPWYISKSIYSWFRTQDKFTKTYVIAFLMIAVATPYIVSQYLNYSQKAASSSVENSAVLRVGIVNPANNDIVKPNSNTSIVANVPESVEVSKVEFYVNGSVECSLIVAPYVCNWKVPPASGVFYSIDAKATGVSGKTALDMIKVTSR
ncbi:MAG: Ig-like domain-containing protein [Patescibacteria group bacterium]